MNASLVRADANVVVRCEFIRSTRASFVVMCASFVVMILAQVF